MEDNLHRKTKMEDYLFWKAAFALIKQQEALPFSRYAIKGKTENQATSIC